MCMWKVTEKVNTNRNILHCYQTLPTLLQVTLR